MMTKVMSCVTRLKAGDALSAFVVQQLLRLDTSIALLPLYFPQAAPMMQAFVKTLKTWMHIRELGLMY